MVKFNEITAVAAAVLLALPAASAEGLYHKQSPVIQVDAKNYDRLVAKSNYTTIVEFYAPWCGHCKNLQPEYEKAARILKGLAKVAAVNCDVEDNKPFCGRFGVQGFPTLKIFKPGKKPEDYNGARESRAIADTVTSKILNHVTKVTDKDLDNFLSKDNSSSKAILFTEKGTTSALLKAVAIDFLGKVQVAQVRSKEKETTERFGITKFPTIVLLPGGDSPSQVYQGDMKKPAIVDFIASSAGPPNPDPAPAKVKMPKKKSASKEKVQKPAADTPPAAEEVLEDFAATESPDPIVTPDATPVDLPKVAPTLPALKTAKDLVQQCLSPKSGTCILAFGGSEESSASTNALSALAETAQKYLTSNHAIFPFYSIPPSNDFAEVMKGALGLRGEVEIIAVNRKRGWWRQYEGRDHSLQNLEVWIDAIRMGEGEKRKLPDTVLAEKDFGTDQKPLKDVPLEEKSDETTAAKVVEPETAAESELEPETTTIEIQETVTQQVSEVTPEATPATEKHDEL